MLSLNAQEKVFDHLKTGILQENFYEQEIDV